MSWTLAEIRQKVRNVTGRLSGTDLTNAQIDTYINNFYVYTLPAELKLERQHTYYTLVTLANQPSYTLPDTGYTSFQPPAFIDELDILWYQDPGVFYQQTPHKTLRSSPWEGDGVTTNFITTISAPPIYPGTIAIADDTETFQDTNVTYNSSPVNITGSLGGTATVNYATGDISVTFNTAPADGVQIFLSYETFVLGRPQSVLMYNNTFLFYPVPSAAHRFRVQAYSIPTPLSTGTDTPTLEEWGPAIAYGASRDILADFAEMDGYQEVTALYQEQLAYIMRRTHQNLLNTRSLPMF